QADVLGGERDLGLLRDAEIVHALGQERAAGRAQRGAPHRRLGEARQGGGGGGLDCTARPDDRGDLGVEPGEGQVVDRGQAAEAHREMLDGEERSRSGRAHSAPFGTAAAACVSRSLMLGSRRASSPRGRQIMIRIIAAPNRSMRYCAKSRPSSGSITSTIAAMTTPTWLPMPPSTTIARIMADSMKVKLSGLMKPWRVAKNEPAKPPNIAPIANAVSLVLVGLMPSAREAISSSRSASQARPIGM